ncbi:DUF2461 domain-containing protein [Micromonospora sp. WMMA1998]|uniref:DUF2461 domain-containing protein n=1 Tax=Micromonospora sp. WMMA1998 TaxID=3015167 RepID=UPI00248B3832|nr:DUF2461 domain-containing protein [Micromonospora sp. WMMA1998]WBC14955.1 DUF2461 domain-containing protein [Micromonospora sp. WMMA1998]
MGEFTGFPQEAFTFYEGLEKDNTKDYWEAHKATWEATVQTPVEQLMRDLEPEFGPLRTFRPQRDVRFSPDKSPYKTWMGVTTTSRAVGGVGCFLRLEAAGLRLACGAMVLARDQLERFRSALDHPTHGPEFDQVVVDLAARGLPVGGGREPALKRVPTGFPKEHPRAESLKWKGVVVVREFERAAWMSTPKAMDAVRDVWQGAAPLNEWIQTVVGPSNEPTGRPGR